MYPSLSIGYLYDPHKRPLASILAARLVSTLRNVAHALYPVALACASVQSFGLSFTSAAAVQRQDR